MAERLMKLEKKDIEYLKNLESITEEQAKDFYLKNGVGSYFIKRSGLLFKMEKKYGANAYGIITEVPDEKEIETIRKMLALNEKELKPFVVMKSRVIIKENGLEFVDYGTASVGNTNSSTKSYLLEMASTRSSNRALRSSTSCGFTSDTEMVFSEEAVTEGEKQVKLEKVKTKTVKKKKDETDNSIRGNRLQAINSIKEDFGYSDAQLESTLKKLFNKESLEDLSDEEVKIVYEKFMNLKNAA